MSDVTRNVTAEYAKARKAAAKFDPGGQPDISALMKSAYMHGYAAALIERPQEAAGSRAAIVELNTYADHTFMCAISERGKYDEVECDCGYEQAERAALSAPVEPSEPPRLTNDQCQAVIADLEEGGDWSGFTNEDIRTIDNAIAAARHSNEPQGWQPMATAPKNGTRVLLHIEEVDRAILSVWNGLHWNTLDGYDWSGRKLLAWHRIPKLPVTKGEAQ